MVSSYRKLLAALSAPVALFATAIADGAISGSEARDIGYGVGAAVLVWLFPNAQKGA